MSIGEAHVSENLVVMLVPSHLWLAYVLLFETNPSPKFVVRFPDLSTSNTHLYFAILQSLKGFFYNFQMI